MEQTKILVTDKEEFSSATGYGDRMTSNRVVSIYRSVNRNNGFKNFGFRYFKIGKIFQKSDQPNGLFQAQGEVISKVTNPETRRNNP